MLPTPAKTPRKKAVRDVGHTAKVLFASNAEEQHTKKGKKFTGFSLDSFHEEPDQNLEKIEIFTDSRDKIPKLDEGEDNPFCSKADNINTPVATSSSTIKRRKLEVKRTKEVEEALGRDDGMIYVL
jgi:hypothetical protein